MKKSLKIFILFFLLISLLISCGKKEKGLVIQYWDTQPDLELTGKILHDQIKAYDEAHPELSIDLQFIHHEQFDTKLQTFIQGKTPPDIVLMDRFVTASYAHAEGLLPLDNFIKRDGIKSSDYFPACWNECIYKNKIWSIPHHTDVRVLYYRIDDYKEVGLDPNRPPKTWDEVFEYAKKLTVKKDGILERIGFVPDLGNTFLHMYAYGNNGKFMRNGKITCNEPAVVQALEWIVKVNDWYGRENVMSANQGFGQREMDPFIMGKLSMIIDGDWYLGILKKFGPDVKFGVAPPPVPRGKNPSTWSGGWALAIPNGSKNTNEAWELIKHLTSYESQITYATQAFRIPANKTAAQNKFFKTNKHYKIFLDLMKYTKYRPVTPISLFYWDKMREALGFSVDHRKSPKQALDDAAKDVKKYLKKYQEQ